MSFQILLEKYLSLATRIGTDSGDSERAAQQKSLLTSAVLLLMPCGPVWGLLYVFAGEIQSGLIPLVYSFISLLSLIHFSVSRRYGFFRLSQLLLILLLPFFLTLSLGSFASSSVVILWSFMSPIGAIFFEERDRIKYWFIGFLGVVVATALLQPLVRSDNTLAPWLLTVFFVMNVSAPMSVAYILISYYVRQEKERTIELMQRTEELQVANEQLEQQNSELAIINSVSQGLVKQLNFQAIVDLVGDKVVQLFEVQTVYIALRDPDPQTRLIRFPYCFDGGRRIDRELLHLDKGLTSLVIRSRQPVIIGTRQQQIALGRIDHGESFGESYLGVPILVGDKVLGAISLESCQQYAYNDATVRPLNTIAASIGVALENAHLFTETEQARAEAEVARAEAEQANAAKSAFLANMSHELRTPLNAIIGFTRIVKRKATSTLPDKQVDNLDKVLVSAEHLLSLINTVLDIAKIEAGRMDVIPAEFNAENLVDLCAVTAQPLLRSGVGLIREVEPELPLVYSDQDKIKQIILNLLSNAAKFTHRGTVRIKAHQRDEMLVVDVTDSGIGISDEALARVFEEFQQADSSTTRQYGGTGLGLPISRKLAQLLGGDLTAMSVEGQGSTFTLAIPLRYVEVTSEPTVVPAGA